jgi:transposase-like protein
LIKLLSQFLMKSSDNRVTLSLVPNGVPSVLNDPRSDKPAILLLLISSIRADGQTQQRLCLDANTVDEYAELMRDGVDFPPIRVWWDGHCYWLTDGFHRLAAAAKANRREMLCEVFRGALSDAQWDSYSANTSHGLRRTTAETHRTIKLALAHPKAAVLSNVQIAKHLSIADATVRRWRRLLSSSHDEDEYRLVTRRGTEYAQNVAKIGKRVATSRRKHSRDLVEEVNAMREGATPSARTLLELLADWASGRITLRECVDRIEDAFQTIPNPKRAPDC